MDLNMNECVIYDFETLSQNTRDGVVVSFAMLPFSEKRYTTNPYTYEELLSNCVYIKFDTVEQIQKYGRKVSKSTLEWWQSQGEAARKQLQPSSSDQSITTLYKFIATHCDTRQLKKSYSRGNTFDTVFLENIMTDTGSPQPFYWATTRDTRSMIEGMSFGMNLNNAYMPDGLAEKFIKHNPCHDIAMDVMRMQLLAQAILGS